MIGAPPPPPGGGAPHERRPVPGVYVRAPDQQCADCTAREYGPTGWREGLVPSHNRVNAYVVHCIVSAEVRLAINDDHLLMSVFSTSIHEHMLAWMWFPCDE